MDESEEREQERWDRRMAAEKAERERVAALEKDVERLGRELAPFKAQPLESIADKMAEHIYQAHGVCLKTPVLHDALLAVSRDRPSTLSAFVRSSPEERERIGAGVVAGAIKRQAESMPMKCPNNVGGDCLHQPEGCPSACVKPMAEKAAATRDGLLPCPFCGSSALNRWIVADRPRAVKDKEVHGVQCENCGAHALNAGAWNMRCVGGDV